MNEKWFGFRRLTQSSIVGQLLVDLLHAFDVEPAALGVVDHRFGVIHPHHAVGGLLHRFRGVPRLVDVAVGKVFQDRDVTPAGKWGPVTTAVDRYLGGDPIPFTQINDSQIKPQIFTI